MRSTETRSTDFVEKREVEELLFGCCVDEADLPAVIPAGFDYAELRVATTRPDGSEEAWRPVRDKLLGLSVPILGFNVLLPQGMPVVGPDVDATRLDRYLQVVFSRMSELGGKYLSFGSGGARSIPDGYDRLAAEHQLREFISRLGQLGEEYGNTVHVEFLNRRESNVIVSLLEAGEYVRTVNRPSVKLLADLYHMMEEDEPFEDLVQVASHVGYVHVADSFRRFPGSGSYPYAQFISTLRKIGYTGPVSVECQWGSDVHSEMRDSASFLRKMFNTGGI